MQLVNTVSDTHNINTEEEMDLEHVLRILIMNDCLDIAFVTFYFHSYVFLLIYFYKHMCVSF